MKHRRMCRSLVAQPRGARELRAGRKRYTFLTDRALPQTIHDLGGRDEGSWILPTVHVTHNARETRTSQVGVCGPQPRRTAMAAEIA
jgi:hypothetical protein